MRILDALVRHLGSGRGRAGMILVVATVRVRPEMTEQYEAAVQELLPNVRASEPGALVYDVGKSRDEPNTYRVVEIYRDEESIALHMTSGLVEAAKPAMMACLASEIEITMHDLI